MLTEVAVMFMNIPPNTSATYLELMKCPTKLNNYHQTQQTRYLTFRGGKIDTIKPFSSISNEVIRAISPKGYGVIKGGEDEVINYA